MSWKEARGVNRNTLLVAVPAVYKFTLTAGQVARLTFGTFTRSLQVSSDKTTVVLGLTAAGVAGANNYPVGASGLAETMQTSVCYLKNTGASAAVVYVLAVLSDVPVPADFGEIKSVNGFDGGDTSTSVAVL